MRCVNSSTPDLTYASLVLPILQKEIFMPRPKGVFDFTKGTHCVIIQNNNASPNRKALSSIIYLLSKMLSSLLL